ncbi:MAG TPA: hypothetical protein [Caudoviricetes sp.]|jgi:hypothetical protein|nr:MAG TPA: hypothetical protein [Caudoviricetes sp.]
MKLESIVEAAIAERANKPDAPAETETPKEG